MIIGQSYAYNGKKFLTPYMAGTGVSFQADANYTPPLWNLKAFNGSRLPELYSKVEFPARTGIYVLDMPIKMPGTDFRIPSNIEHYAPIIKKMVSIRSSDSYCYVTIDESGVSRNSGCHVDGFQGARIGAPLPRDYSFIAYSVGSTDFFRTNFKVHGLDRAKDNFFKEFDRQVSESDKVQYPANTIIGMDAYTVHRSARVQGDRTFIRVSFSVREFDRLGNTLNPMFDYAWTMLPRDVSKCLI